MLGSRSTCRLLFIVFLLLLLIVPVFANTFYRENASVAVLQGSYIQIDPVGTRQPGEKLTITATTDLPVGSPVLFEVLTTPGSPTSKNPAGEFSGATGTVTVYSGQDRKQNLLSFDVDLSAFKQGNYHILASSANNAVTGSGEFTVISVITRQPPLPVFTFSPSPAIVDQPVAFDGSRSADPDGKIITYQWDFGDGTPRTTPSGSPGDAHVSHTYQSAGKYTVGLVVMDNNEQSVWAYNEVRVLVPVSPVADFSISPVSGQAYENHPFAVSITDKSTGSPLTWAWYVDNTLVSQMWTYSQSIFTEPGNYTIKLVVTNDYGTSSKEKQVTVLPFQTVTNPPARTSVSQTQTTTATPSQPVTTITPVPTTPIPTTPVPQCLTCESPCVFLTIPCIWIDSLAILIIVVLVISYILRRRPPRRCTTSDPPKKTTPAGDEDPPTHGITMVTRGGISPRGLDMNNPDIHVDVESGIQYHTREE